MGRCISEKSWMYMWVFLAYNVSAQTLLVSDSSTPPLHDASQTIGNLLSSDYKTLGATATRSSTATISAIDPSTSSYWNMPKTQAPLSVTTSMLSSSWAESAFSTESPTSSRQTDSGVTPTTGELVTSSDGISLISTKSSHEGKTYSNSGMFDFSTSPYIQSNKTQQSRSTNLSPGESLRTYDSRIISDLSPSTSSTLYVDPISTDSSPSASSIPFESRTSTVDSTRLSLTTNDGRITTITSPKSSLTTNDDIISTDLTLSSFLTTSDIKSSIVISPSASSTAYAKRISIDSLHNTYFTTYGDIIQPSTVMEDTSSAELTPFLLSSSLAVSKKTTTKSTMFQSLESIHSSRESIESHYGTSFPIVSSILNAGDSSWEYSQSSIPVISVTPVSSRSKVETSTGAYSSPRVTDEIEFSVLGSYNLNVTSKFYIRPTKSLSDISPTSVSSTLSVLVQQTSSVLAHNASLFALLSLSFISSSYSMETNDTASSIRDRSSLSLNTYSTGYSSYIISSPMSDFGYGQSTKSSYSAFGKSDIVSMSRITSLKSSAQMSSSVSYRFIDSFDTIDTSPTASSAVSSSHKTKSTFFVELSELSKSIKHSLVAPTTTLFYSTSRFSSSKILSPEELLLTTSLLLHPSDSSLAQPTHSQSTFASKHTFASITVSDLTTTVLLQASSSSYLSASDNQSVQTAPAWTITSGYSSSDITKSVSSDLSSLQYHSLSDVLASGLSTFLHTSPVRSSFSQTTAGITVLYSSAASLSSTSSRLDFSEFNHVQTSVNAYESSLQSILNTPTTITDQLKTYSSAFFSESKVISSIHSLRTTLFPTEDFVFSTASATPGTIISYSKEVSELTLSLSPSPTFLSTLVELSSSSLMTENETSLLSKYIVTETLDVWSTLASASMSISTETPLQSTGDHPSSFSISRGSVGVTTLSPSTSPLTQYSHPVSVSSNVWSSSRHPYMFTSITKTPISSTPAIQGTVSSSSIYISSRAPENISTAHYLSQETFTGEVLPVSFSPILSPSKYTPITSLPSSSHSLVTSMYFGSLYLHRSEASSSPLRSLLIPYDYSKSIHVSSSLSTVHVISQSLQKSKVPHTQIFNSTSSSGFKSDINTVFNISHLITTSSSQSESTNLFSPSSTLNVVSHLGTGFPTMSVEHMITLTRSDIPTAQRGTTDGVSSTDFISPTSYANDLHFPSSSQSVSMFHSVPYLSTPYVSHHSASSFDDISSHFASNLDILKSTMYPYVKTISKTSTQYSQESFSSPSVLISPSKSSFYIPFTSKFLDTISENISPLITHLPSQLPSMPLVSLLTSSRSTLLLSPYPYSSPFPFSSSFQTGPIPLFSESPFSLSIDMSPTELSHKYATVVSVSTVSRSRSKLFSDLSLISLITDSPKPTYLVSPSLQQFTHTIDLTISEFISSSTEQSSYLTLPIKLVSSTPSESKTVYVPSELTEVLPQSTNVSLSISYIADASEVSKSNGTTSSHALIETSSTIASHTPFYPTYVFNISSYVSSVTAIQPFSEMPSSLHSSESESISMSEYSKVKTQTYSKKSLITHATGMSTFSVYAKSLSASTEQSWQLSFPHSPTSFESQTVYTPSVLTEVTQQSTVASLSISSLPEASEVLKFDTITTSYPLSETSFTNYDTYSTTSPTSQTPFSSFPSTYEFNTSSKLSSVTAIQTIPELPSSLHSSEARSISSSEYYEFKTQTYSDKNLITHGTDASTYQVDIKSLSASFSLNISSTILSKYTEIATYSKYPTRSASDLVNATSSSLLFTSFAWSSQNSGLTARTLTDASLTKQQTKPFEVSSIDSPSLPFSTFSNSIVSSKLDFSIRTSSKTLPFSTYAHSILSSKSEVPIRTHPKINVTHYVASSTRDLSITYSPISLSLSFTGSITLSGYSSFTIGKSRETIASSYQISSSEVTIPSLVSLSYTGTLPSSRYFKTSFSANDETRSETDVIIPALPSFSFSNVLDISSSINSELTTQIYLKTIYPTGSFSDQTLTTSSIVISGNSYANKATDLSTNLKILSPSSSFVFRKNISSSKYFGSTFTATNFPIYSSSESMVNTSSAVLLSSSARIISTSEYSDIATNKFMDMNITEYVTPSSTDSSTLTSLSYIRMISSSIYSWKSLLPITETSVTEYATRLFTGSYLKASLTALSSSYTQSLTTFVHSGIPTQALPETQVTDYSTPLFTGSFIKATSLPFTLSFQSSLYSGITTIILPTPSVLSTRIVTDSFITASSSVSSSYIRSVSSTFYSGMSTYSFPVTSDSVYSASVLTKSFINATETLLSSSFTTSIQFSVYSGITKRLFSNTEYSTGLAGYLTKPSSTSMFASYTPSSISPEYSGMTAYSLPVTSVSGYLSRLLTGSFIKASHTSLSSTYSPSIPMPVYSGMTTHTFPVTSVSEQSTRFLTGSVIKMSHTSLPSLYTPGRTMSVYSGMTADTFPVTSNSEHSSRLLTSSISNASQTLLSSSHTASISKSVYSGSTTHTLPVTSVNEYSTRLLTGSHIKSSRSSPYVPSIQLSEYSGMTTHTFSVTSESSIKASIKASHMSLSSSFTPSSLSSVYTGMTASAFPNTSSTEYSPLSITGSFTKASLTSLSLSYPTSIATSVYSEIIISAFPETSASEFSSRLSTESFVKASLTSSYSSFTPSISSSQHSGMSTITFPNKTINEYTTHSLNGSFTKASSTSLTSIYRQSFSSSLSSLSSSNTPSILMSAYSGITTPTVQVSSVSGYSTLLISGSFIKASSPSFSSPYTQSSQSFVYSGRTTTSFALTSIYSTRLLTGSFIEASLTTMSMSNTPSISSTEYSGLTIYTVPKPSNTEYEASLISSSSSYDLFISSSLYTSLPHTTLRMSVTKYSTPLLTRLDLNVSLTSSNIPSISSFLYSGMSAYTRQETSVSEYSTSPFATSVTSPTSSYSTSTPSVLSSIYFGMTTYTHQETSVSEYSTPILTESGFKPSHISLSSSYTTSSSSSSYSGMTSNEYQVTTVSLYSTSRLTGSLIKAPMTSLHTKYTPSISSSLYSGIIYQETSVSKYATPLFTRSGFKASVSSLSTLYTPSDLSSVYSGTTAFTYQEKSVSEYPTDSLTGSFIKASMTSMYSMESQSIISSAYSGVTAFTYQRTSVSEYSTRLFSLSSGHTGIIIPTSSDVNSSYHTPQPSTKSIIVITPTSALSSTHVWSFSPSSQSFDSQYFHSPETLTVSLSSTDHTGINVSPSPHVSSRRSSQTTNIVTSIKSSVFSRTISRVPLSSMFTNLFVSSMSTTIPYSVLTSLRTTSPVFSSPSSAGTTDIIETISSTYISDAETTQASSRSYPSSSMTVQASTSTVSSTFSSIRPTRATTTVESVSSVTLQSSEEESISTSSLSVIPITQSMDHKLSAMSKSTLGQLTSISRSIMPTTVVSASMSTSDTFSSSIPAPTTERPRPTTVNVTNARESNWVKTVLKLSRAIDVTDAKLREDLEAKLAEAFDEAFIREELYRQGKFKPLKKRRRRRKRFSSVGAASVHIQDISRVGDTSTVIVSYSVANSDVTLTSTEAVEALDMLDTQELAIILKQVVSSKVAPYIDVKRTEETDEASRVFYIAIIAAPICAVIIILWIVVCVYCKYCKRKGRRHEVDEPELLSIGHPERTKDVMKSYPNTPKAGTSFPPKRVSRQGTQTSLKHTVNSTATDSDRTSLGKTKKSSPTKTFDKIPSRPASGIPKINGTVVMETSLTNEGPRLNVPKSAEEGKREGKKSGRKSRRNSVEPMAVPDGRDHEDKPEMSDTRLLLAHSGMDDNEELQERRKAERRKNKERLREKRRKERGIASYVSAQNELNRVMGMPNTTVPNMYIEEGSSKKSLSRQDSGVFNGTVQPEENIDEARHRMHKLLDEAFSLISPRASMIDHSSRHQMKTAASPPYSRRRGSNTSHRGQVAADKPSPTASFYVNPAYEYQEGMLETWSPYRSSDNIALISMPNKPEPVTSKLGSKSATDISTDAGNPVQRARPAATFDNTASRATSGKSNYATNSAKPIVLRTKDSNDAGIDQSETLKSNPRSRSGSKSTGSRGREDPMLTGSTSFLSKRPASRDKKGDKDLRQAWEGPDSTGRKKSRDAPRQDDVTSDSRNEPEPTDDLLKSLREELQHLKGQYDVDINSKPIKKTNRRKNLKSMTDIV